MKGEEDAKQAMAARFDEQALRIRGFLRTDVRYNQEFLPPPFCIEFTGSPSSGKTTTIKQIYNFLRRHGFEVLMPQEGAEVIPGRMRDKPDYNVQTAVYALRILLLESREHRYDFVLFDRCVFDAYHWMLYWQEKNKLSRGDAEVIQNFFLLWAQKINLSYVMVCAPDIAIRRENEVALSDKLGETTNPAAIAKMVTRFTNMYVDLAPRFPQLRLIDTSALSKRDMILTVGAEILGTFEKASEKRTAGA
ncbi:MAG: AAA family ATPase [Patescibacteria group bacterium]